MSSSLLLMAAAGFTASFVDGALGMGFGPTSSSILLAGGASPVTVSATVNIAKVATGLAAGVSHWRFRNIDRRLVLRLAIPGAIGSIIGATLLTRVDGKHLKPWLALLLVAVGIRILLRFSHELPATIEHGDQLRRVRGVEVAGVAGGVTNGLVGAWGPVVTPYLLHKGVPPRYVVGSVNTAEVAVAIVAVGSLASSAEGLDVVTVAAMLIGGVVASPVAAWTVRFIAARPLGLLVAGLLLLTNARELCSKVGLRSTSWLVYGAIAALVALAWLRPRLSARRLSNHPRVGVIEHSTNRLGELAIDDLGDGHVLEDGANRRS
jgi:uncharacterized protein